MLIEAPEVTVRIGIGTDDDRLLLRAEREPVGGDVRADAAEEDVEVGLGEHPLGHRGRPVPEDAEEVRAVVVDPVVGAERAEHPETPVGRPAGDALGRGLRPVLPADDEDGTLGLIDAGPHLGEVAVVGGGHPDGQGRQRRGGRALGQHLLGQADDDGTRPAGHRGVQGIGDHLGGLVGIIEDEDLLRRRAEPPGEVELLEGLPTAVGGGDEADEDDERGRVLVGGVDGGHDVRGTGTAGDHRDPRHPGHPPLGHGHVPGPALLAADDRGDRRIVESVEDIEVGLARDEVGAADAVGLELADDEVAGGQRL